jgi:molybdate transport system regulatory protein
MNRLPGHIIAVEQCGSIALIDVAALGQYLTATLVGASREVSTWPTGMAVTLVFSETEVALAKNLQGLISMRNRIAGTVVAVERGAVLCRVTLDVSGHRLVSIITTRSANALSLACGDAVEALVKANEMSLLTANPLPAVAL